MLPEYLKSLTVINRGHGGGFIMLLVHGASLSSSFAPVSRGQSPYPWIKMTTTQLLLPVWKYGDCKYGYPMRPAHLETKSSAK